MACKRIFGKDILGFVCACLNFGLCLSLLLSMNVLFTDWMTSFDANRGSTTAVQATGYGLNFGAGVIAGMLETRLGSRVCLLLGAVLAAGGYLAGAFVTSLPALIVSVGVVTGCGSCLIHLSTLSTAIGRFHKRAVFISSSMGCTLGLMHLGFPLLYRYLAEHYTWRGCLIFSSGGILQTAVLGLLLTSSFTTHTHRKRLTRSADTCDHDVTTGIGASDAKTGSDASEVNAGNRFPDIAFNINTENCSSDVLAGTDDVSTERNGASDVTASIEAYDVTGNYVLTNNPGSDVSSKDCVQRHVRSGCHTGDTELSAMTSETRNNTPSSLESLESLESFHSQEGAGKEAHCPQSTTTDEYRDGELSADKLPNVSSDDSSWVAKFKSILTDRLYLAVLLCTVTHLGTSISFVFLVLDFAIHKGWSKEDGVLFNFLFQLLGLVSRVLVAMVGGLKVPVSSISLLIVSALAGSVSLLFVGQVSSFHLAAVLYAGLGLAYGGHACLFPAAVLQVVGRGVNYPLALGLCCTIEGILNTVLGILTGVWVDVQKSYSVISLVYGLLCLASSLLLLGVYLCHKHRHLKVDIIY